MDYAVIVKFLEAWLKECFSIIRVEYAFDKVRDSLLSTVKNILHKMCMCSAAYVTYIWNFEENPIWVVRFADASRHMKSD